MSNEPKRYDLYAGLNVSAYTTATAVLKCEESETGMWIDYKDYEKLKKQLEWQPIETAPRDWTWILGLNVENKKSCIVRWSSKEDYIERSKKEGTANWRYSAHEGWISYEKDSVYLHPTHWIPLPKPPVQ